MFVAFDLTMIGYAAGPALGAHAYNAGHSFVGPAVAGSVAVVAAARGGRVGWLEVLALAWVFHIGVDRSLGYGLKCRDGFEHTHLGSIGKARSAAGEAR